MGHQPAIDEQLLAQIVSDVIQQLGSPVPSVRAAVKSASPGSPTPESPGAATRRAAGNVVLAEKVITAELLEQHLNGDKHIQVAAHAVLTPSARDFLNGRNIRWSRLPTDAEATRARTTWKAFVVQSTTAVAAALDDVGPANRVDWTRQLAGDSAEAVGLAVSALCRAEAVGVVVFTSQPQAIACRTNRNRKVRAAAVADVASARSARSDMGANLFCVDADGRSYFELRNILREITAGGSPQAPSDWNE